MNIFKLKVSANECTWVAADKIEFIDVVSGTAVHLSLMGTGDDLALDEVVITATTGNAGAVALELAELIHEKGKKKAVVDVLAMPKVSSIAALAAA
tara:strand:- start:42 stop:329 length:288 start_codon:yes stop_codon:yes gene_type:complete